jgi:hypothetical protein
MEVAGYQGVTAQIPLGNLGVMTDLAPGQIPPTALIKAFDVDFGPGYIQKAPGSLRYNTTPFSSGIVALIDYWPSTYTQRLLAATADGKVYRDTGDRLFGSNTAILSSLGALNTFSNFVIGGAEIAGNDKKVFLFTDGRNQVKVLQGDASVFNTIANPAADWTTPNYPKFGLIHRNRLFAFMKNRYYASMTSNHENFTDSTVLTGAIGPGDGGDAVAAIVFKGRMLVFKEGDIVYYLDDTDTNSTNWVFKRFGEGFGIASQHSATQVLDDLLVGNNTGSVTSYKAVQAFGDLQSGDIFRQAKVNQFFRERTSFSGAPYMQSLWYPEKHIAWFTARTMFGTSNNALIALDLQNPDAPRYSLWKKDAADCMTLRYDINRIRRPIYGAADGYIYLMDREDRLVGSTSYTGEFETPHLDFRYLDPTFSHRNKVFDFLGVTFQEEGNHDLSVDIYIDGKFSQTVTFKQSVGTNYLGSFTLGTSKLGVEDEKTLWKPIKGSGRRIAFRCYNSGSNQNFKVSQLTVGFQPSGEDVTRV